MEIENCPKCGTIFAKTPLRDVCDSCFREEERIFEEVYKFLKKRENRAASIERIIEMLDVEESLLLKWVRKGRLHPAQFPNLQYPCDVCGTLIRTGTMCENCAQTIQAELTLFEKEQERQKKLHNSVYYSQNHRK